MKLLARRWPWLLKQHDCADPDSCRRLRQVIRAGFPFRISPWEARWMWAEFHQGGGAITASDLPPAAELRAAAAHMREHHGPDHPRHGFWFAVAEWLEAEADHYDGLGPAAQAFLAGDEGGDPDPAIIAARSYLAPDRP